MVDRGFRHRWDKKFEGWTHANKGKPMFLAKSCWIYLAAPYCNTSSGLLQFTPAAPPPILLPPPPPNSSKNDISQLSNSQRSFSLIKAARMSGDGQERFNERIIRRVDRLLFDVSVSCLYLAGRLSISMFIAPPPLGQQPR